MTRTLPLAEAREQLASLPEQFADDPSAGAVTVTDDGRPVLAVLSWSLYESLVETLEVLGDEEAMTAIEQSRADISAGRTVSLQEIQRKFHL